MASQNKKNKTNKKSHPGRGGSFLKSNKGAGIKGVSFFNASDRREDNRKVLEDDEVYRLAAGDKSYEDMATLAWMMNNNSI